MNVFACLGKVLDAVADTSVTVSNVASATAKLGEVAYIKATAYLEQVEFEDNVLSMKAKEKFLNEAADDLAEIRKIRANRCSEFNTNSEDRASWQSIYAELDALCGKKNNPSAKKEKQNKSAK